MILTGGSCKFYLVQETLQNYFGAKKQLIPFTNSDAVSKGAAIFSHTIDNEDFNKISIQDSLSDSIFVKFGSKYKLLLSNDTKPGSTGVFPFAFKRPSNRIELFLYYGLEGDEPFKLKEISGVFYKLNEWFDKDQSIDIHLEFDVNKILHLYYDGQKLLSTEASKVNESALLNYYKLNPQ